MSDKATHRIHVIFSGEAYEALSYLVAVKGKTAADVLRDAVTVEKWLNDMQRDGGRILVERNGEVQEVVFK